MTRDFIPAWYRSLSLAMVFSIFPQPLLVCQLGNHHGGALRPCREMPVPFIRLLFRADSSKIKSV